MATHNAHTVGLSPSDPQDGHHDSDDHHDDEDDDLMEAEDVGGWSEVRERTSKKKEPEVKGNGKHSK